MTAYIRTARMNQSELIANMETTAAKLSGHVVTVRIRKPPGATGRACKDLRGRVVIDLDPALFDPRNLKQFAEVFAHEAAHVKLHFDGMPRMDIDAPPSIPDEKKLNALIQLAGRVKPEVKRREQEADTLAAHWMGTLKRHFEGYRATCKDDYLAIMQVLYHKVGG